MLSIFLDHNEIKLEINNKRNLWNCGNIWKLNNMLLNDHWVKEEIKKEIRLGVVAHACTPSTLEGWGKWITWGCEFETNLTKMEKPVSTKKHKISPAWWLVPVIPTTREAEAGEWFEPGRWRFRWAEITPLHSSLGNKSETPSQNKTKNKQTKILS